MAPRKTKNISLSLIDPPKELARLEIPESQIVELAASIQARGLLQPIRLHAVNGRFEIIFGHRRYLAHKYLAKKTIEADVVEETAENILLDRAIENLQRADLSPLEEALQYQALFKELNVNYEKLAKSTGKSAGTIKRILNILKMPDYLQSALHNRKISKGVAEEFQACSDETQKQYFVELAVEHGITVSIARLWVNDWRKSKRGAPTDVDEGGSLNFTPSNEPVYVTCFMCNGPTEIMQTTNLTVCSTCVKQLKDVLK